MEFYPAGARVPDELRTDRLLLRPLRSTDVALDYDAVMSSAAELRRWSQTAWPADDFTLAENLADLERHEREHLAREAFTFTVLDREATRCLGCVYIKPPPAGTGPLPDAGGFVAVVGFWVRASEIASHLDAHLLAALRQWLGADWAFDRVLFTVAEEETRQVELMGMVGLGRRASITLQDGRRCWVFE